MQRSIVPFGFIICGTNRAGNCRAGEELTATINKGGQSKASCHFYCSSTTPKAIYSLSVDRFFRHSRSKNGLGLTRFYKHGKVYLLA